MLKGFRGLLTAFNPAMGIHLAVRTIGFCMMCIADGGITFFSGMVRGSGRAGAVVWSSTMGRITGMWVAGAAFL